MHRRLKTPFKDVRAIYTESRTQNELRFCCLETMDSFEAIDRGTQLPEGKKEGTSFNEAIDFLGSWLLDKMVHSLFNKDGPIPEEWLSFYKQEELDDWKIKLLITEKEYLLHEWMSAKAKPVNFFDAINLINPSFRQKIATSIVQIDYLAAMFTTSDPNDILCRALRDVYNDGKMLIVLMDVWLIFNSLGKEDMLAPIKEKATISTALEKKATATLVFEGDRTVNVSVRDFISCLSENENFKNQLVFDVDRYLYGHRSMRGIFDELVCQYKFGPVYNQNNVYQGVFIPVSKIEYIRFRNKNIWENKERTGS